MNENREDSERLDQFLKRNASEVPPAPEREKEIIWARIASDAASRGQRPWYWPRLATVLPMALVFVGAFVVVEQRRLKHDADVDRVLAAVLAYQMEADSDLD